MKFKKIMAGVLAASLAVTSLSVGAWATDAAAPKETTLYEYDATAPVEVPQKIAFNNAAKTALASAATDVVITITGTGSGSFYVQEGTTWRCVGGGSTTLTIDGNTKYDKKDDESEGPAALADLKTKTDIYVCPQGFTAISKVEVSVDSGSAIEIYNSSDAPAGKQYDTNGADFPISASTLSSAGVTEDNATNCSLKVTFATVGSGKGITLRVGTAWDKKMAWSNSYSASEVTIPFDGSLGNQPLQSGADIVSGINLYIKDSLVSKVVLVVPAAAEEGGEGGEDPVTPPAEDNKKNYTLVGTETVCGNYGADQMWKELPFDVAEGDVIAITYKDKVIDQSAGKWPTIILASTTKDANGKDNIKIATIDASMLTADSGTYKYTITAQDVTNLKGGKLCLLIVNMTVSKIVINPEEGGNTTETSTEILTAPITEIVNWDYTGKDVINAAFANIKADDKIIFSFEKLDPAGNDPQLQIATKEGSDWTWKVLVDAATPTDGKYTYIADEETAAAIKSNSMICLKGDNAKVTSILLVIKSVPVPENPEEGGDNNENQDTADTPNKASTSSSGGNRVSINSDSTTDSTADVTPTEVVTAANGETVEAPANVVPAGATLEVKEETKEDAVKAVEAVKATDENKEVVETVKKAVEEDKAVVVEIDLVKDGEKVQPNGTIKVTINVPAALKDAAKLFVYRVEANGTFTDVKAAVENGKLVFTTSHFSTYIVTSEALSGDAVVTEATEAAPAETTAPAAPANPEDKNQNTGVVLAIVPAILAAAGVMVAKKRK